MGAIAAPKREQGPRGFGQRHEACRETLRDTLSGSLGASLPQPRDVFVSVYFALHNAYAAECERQMRLLTDEIEQTKQIAGADSHAVRAAVALVGEKNEGVKS